MVVLAMLGLAASPAVGQLSTLSTLNDIVDVQANYGINPATGLPWKGGDTYRFSFTSSATTQATSTDINYYNTFVQNLANASPLDIGAAQGVTWKVIGSTATVYARDNTSTNIDVYGTGEATYLLDGTMVAPDYIKLWGSGGSSVGLPNGHNNAINKTELLTTPPRVYQYGDTFTGVYRHAYPNVNYGTASADDELGAVDGTAMGGLWPYTSGTHWIWRWARATTDELPVYGLSMPLSVQGPPPLYWDIDGATAGAGGASPAGTWDASTANWNNDSTGGGGGTIGAWTPGQIAYFAAGSDASGTYAVTVDGMKDIGGLVFTEGNVTLSGGGLRMTEDSPVVVVEGATATITSTISEDASPRRLAKCGDGTLILSDVIAYTGPTVVNGGTLILSGSSSYPGATTIDRGVLETSANAANLGTGALVFNSDTTTEPAILRASGTFARNIGTGAGEVSWAGHGGFSAVGGPLTVTLNGGAAISSSAADGLNGKRLQMGSAAADAPVEITNDIDYGSSLSVVMFDNTNTSADIAILSGDLVGAGNFGASGEGTVWLTGNNSFGGGKRLGCSEGPVIRAEDGVGLPADAVLFFNNGIFESNGTLTREPGNAAGKVYWNGDGGFSAAGGPLSVALVPTGGGSPGDALSWGTDFRSRHLYMGSPTADDVVTFVNDIDCGGGRTIAVLGNPDSDADGVVFSGNITSTGTLTVTGKPRYDFRKTVPYYLFPGELRFTGTVDANVNVRDGAALGGDGTITGNLNVQSTGGIVAPGARVGTLNVEGNATLQDDSNYAWEIGESATDVLNVIGGTLTLGDFVLQILDAGGTVANGTVELPVFTYGGGATVDMSGFADQFDVSELDETWTIGALALTDGGAGTIYLTGLSGGSLPSLPGDANGNGFVDDDDLAILLSNWEQDPGTITTWQLGDFTADTDVDDDDLAVLLGNWTGPAPGGAAVPEPATLALLGLGGLSVLRRRRK